MTASSLLTKKIVEQILQAHAGRVDPQRTFQNDSETLEFHLHMIRSPSVHTILHSTIKYMLEILGLLEVVSILVKAKEYKKHWKFLLELVYTLINPST